MRMRKNRTWECGWNAVPGADFRPGGAEGKVAGADARGEGGLSGAGLRQGPLYGGDCGAESTGALYCGVERVPDAMVIAMERVCAQELHNVFLDGDVAQLPLFFAPGEVDRIYINFCDPWPSNRHAKRRLTHPDFLLRYRQVLAEAGEIHFKTDNRDLFEWSLFPVPQGGLWGV